MAEYLLDLVRRQMQFLESAVVVLIILRYMRIDVLQGQEEKPHLQGIHGFPSLN